MKMPGFSNYDPNFTNESIKIRKEAIESLQPEQLQFIQVTIGSDLQKEKLINQVNKIVENS
jgi:hypothetical protein